MLRYNTPLTHCWIWSVQYLVNSKMNLSKKYTLIFFILWYKISILNLFWSKIIPETVLGILDSIAQKECKAELDSRFPGKLFRRMDLNYNRRSVPLLGILYPLGQEPQDSWHLGLCPFRIHYLFRNLKYENYVFM